MRVRQLINWSLSDRTSASDSKQPALRGGLDGNAGRCSELDLFQGLSFTTISSTGPNGGKPPCSSAEFDRLICI